jgi:hypothetical protein
MTRTVIESPPVILTWRRDKTTITMLDTLNWWRMPLAKIGDSIGIPKLAMPQPDAPMAQWHKYGRRDVDVIHRAVREWWQFLADNDLGGFAPTLASQALRAYRHRFIGAPILIDDDRHALDLARMALHGGRTEAFRLGRVEGPIHCFDVNSMYPAVMRSNPYPTILRLSVRKATLDELTRWLERYCVVARVNIETTRRRFAHVHDGRLVFPIGRLSLALTTPDLQDAMRHGEIRSVSACAVYEGAPIFGAFVDTMHKERLSAQRNGNPVRSWLFKILLNSLYGKFAQRGETWVTYGTTPDDAVRVWRELDIPTGELRTFRQFSGVIQASARAGESHDSHPAIAAHVTAYARARLWELCDKADHSHVFYVDTDSIYTDEHGAAALANDVDPTRLGALKREGVFPYMVVHGAKDYELAGKIVCKGVRAKAEWIGKGVVVQDEWSTLIGLVRRGCLDAPTTARRRKTLHREYTKGIPNADGTVSPLTLCDW